MAPAGHRCRKRISPGVKAEVTAASRLVQAIVGRLFDALNWVTRPRKRLPSSQATSVKSLGLLGTWCGTF